MKEAAGEANMTVITIILIAIVLAVGTVIITSLMETTANRSCCAQLGGTVNGKSCTNAKGTREMNKTWREEKCS